MNNSDPLYISEFWFCVHSDENMDDITEVYLRQSSVI